MEKYPLDFFAFFVPILVLIAFYGFGIQWQYLAGIGLPLACVIYYLRMKEQKTNKSQQILATVAGLLIILSMLLFYLNR